MSSHTHNYDQNRSVFLRRALATDAMGTGAMAAGMVLGAQPLAAALGMPAWLLTALGLALLPFAAWVGWLSRRRYTEPSSTKLVWLLIAGNMAWAIDSAVLIVGGWLPLTAIGTEFVAIQAILTLGITALEYVGVKRVTQSLSTHESAHA
jgi:hypothetical protein